ncbi:MAG: YbaB/EbfC family nucleoid-associated protein [Deltaproteobacteria bacterium]|nr:YbaB/EbfC family nucleoid-associated protein [Deltaproteobacteria bacterium]
MTDPSGLEGLFKMESLMRMAQDLQKKLQDTQGEIAAIKATAAAGGGLVTATVNGKHRILTLKIEREAFSGEELEVLEDLVVTAINMAMEKVDAEIGERMREVTGGLPLPFPLPGLGG